MTTITPTTKTRCQEASEEMSSILDSLYEEFSQKYSSRSELISDTGAIMSMCKDILRECPRYEWNDIPASGFRSCVNKWRQLVIYSLGPKIKKEKQVQDLTDIVKVLKDLLPRVSEHLNENLEEKLEPCDRNTKRCLDLMKFMTSESEVIEAMFNDVALEFDHKLVGNILINFSMLFTAAVVSDGVISSSHTILSRKQRLKVIKEFYRTAEYDKIMDVLSYNNTFLYARLYPFLAFGTISSMKRVIRVPRINNWSLKLDSVDRKIDVVYNETIIPRQTKRNSTTIGCFINRVKASSKDPVNFLGKVLIYVHGGGFLVNDMRTTNNFLPRFAVRMPGLTIISVDISLAQDPTGKYPTPINEVLDVIYWLQSGDESVKSLLKLSDQPTEYMIAGDSSGAFITLQTMAVLAEINRQIRLANQPVGHDDTSSSSSSGSDQPEANDKHIHSTNNNNLFHKGNNWKEIQLPSKVIGLSPVFAFCPTFIPSMALAVKDLLLFPTVLWHMGFSYLPELHDQDGNVETSIRLWNEKESFFLAPVEDSLEKIQNYYFMFQHRLFNTMLFDHWDEFKEVPFYMLSSEDDPLLDMGLGFLPKWKGPVTLDVMPVLKHGFFYFHSVAHVIFRPLKKRLLEAEDILIKRLSDDTDNHNHHLEKKDKNENQQKIKV